VCCHFAAGNFVLAVHTCQWGSWLVLVVLGDVMQLKLMPSKLAFDSYQHPLLRPV
jgi:hypothetical protein